MYGGEIEKYDEIGSRKKELEGELEKVREKIHEVRRWVIVD